MLSLLNEIKLWKCHYTLQEPQEDPTRLLLPLRTVSPTSRRWLELVTLPVGNADAERSLSCISAATKEAFKEQS